MTISRRDLLIGIGFIIAEPVLAASLPVIPVTPAQQNTRKNLYGVEIYTLDTLQRSGHILSTDEAQKIVSFWQGRKIFGQLSSASSYAEEVKGKITGTVDMSIITHVVSNLKVDNGKLIGDIEILSTEAGEQLESLYHYGLVSFKPYGFANIDSDGNMTSYKLVRIDAIYQTEPSSSVRDVYKDYYLKSSKRYYKLYPSFM